MIPPSGEVPLQIIGWVGNVCFFSRFLVQWWASERARRSVAPPLFWWLSIAGTLTLGLYALARQNYVLLVGYAVNGLIYARNLRLVRAPGRPFGSWALALLALAAVVLLVAAGLYELRHRAESQLAWIVVAGLGQACWSARFVVQWWASERAAESHFPPLFWWLSLVGNLLLLAFTIHLGDLLLILGFVPNPIVQIRNLMLARRNPRA